jgi:serine/threonine protein kinase
VFPLERLDNYEREKATLTQLNHPHIIKPIDYSHAYVAKVANTVLNAVILFPEYPKGDLFGYITKNGPLSEKVTLYFTRQIIKALSYAHENHILHPNLLL